MKNYLLGFLLLTAVTAQAQTPISFNVKGTVGKLNAPAKIYLVRGGNVLDSATFKNGAFELRGKTDVPQSADLVIKRDGKLGEGMFGIQDATRVYLEASPVVLTSPDSLRKATIKGGPVTADDQQLQASLKPILVKIQAFGAEAKKASKEERESPLFQERMRTQFEAINKEYAQLYRAFIKANPNSWVSLDILSSLGMMEAPEYTVVAPLYNAFSPALKRSPQGQRYGELVQTLKAVSLGSMAPSFTQKTPEGKSVSLADYRGKYVLVDFWASWCGPCREDNPNVRKVYSEFKSRNFEILGISLDNEKARDKWLKAIQDDQLAWTQVSDLKGWENEVARLYRIQSIPQNFLIDPSGKIVAHNLHGDELRNTLAQFIK
ncbi:TlpA disulfide reductase family protein [Hymenobacter sp. GOD-10R]|uniref:TlpA disulfide reductase family protein n=1 Tax=Hymenobacter sp. GOD-10R TaxID=3093922 RepID=UPI002D774C31|nr:TlpA disulfide reductase family protein [Hymenobacter sp. GOD-10R]WRQ29891.1 TlpA disulfide reductase family protein [Hymenobacter sp. GOD-10R]